MLNRTANMCKGKLLPSWECVHQTLAAQKAAKHMSCEAAPAGQQHNMQHSMQILRLMFSKCALKLLIWIPV